MQGRWLPARQLAALFAMSYQMRKQIAINFLHLANVSGTGTKSLERKYGAGNLS
jgi:hypothetical protein